MKSSYRGRLGQIPIYLGKCFRSFLYMDDWKMLPMSAVIAGIVSLVACQYLFVTMEGTTSGGFTLVCVCIWVGMFNSIQVICRERSIVKREHRSGMHISSYVISHMIYQAFLCILQTIIILMTCKYCNVQFPSDGVVFRWFMLDAGITLFLITYSADMLSLMISGIVSTPTAAMTIVPFVLIVQLVFSGTMFPLEGEYVKYLTGLTISKWGMECLCSIGNYNSLPMVSLWNQIFNYRNIEIGGVQPIRELTNYMQYTIADESTNLTVRDQFNLQVGQYNANPAYANTQSHVLDCWGMLILFAIIYAVITILILERIDRDKR
ncbi:MAG: ABC transporter permease [Lachnospiraceae bacterium]|nr:ABC transporter permease [Lachnospiraceae bacterium]